MNNRTKAVFFTLFSCIFFPLAIFGIPSLYVGEVTTWLLAMLFFWTGLGLILTFLNFWRFLSMTDEKFDSELGVEFKKIHPFKRSQFLFSLGLFSLSVGVALATAKKDVVSFYPEEIKRFLSDPNFTWFMFAMFGFSLIASMMIKDD